MACSAACGALSLSDIMKCSICLETWTDPRYIPSCDHTFCLQCLKTYVEKLVEERETPRCPLCRQIFNIPKAGIGALPKHFMHQQLLDAHRAAAVHTRMKEEKDSECTRCEQHNKKMKLYCQDCNKLLCTICYATQHQGHKCAEINDAAKGFLDKIISCQISVKTGITKTKANLCQFDKDINEFLEMLSDAEKKLQEKEEDLIKLIKAERKQLQNELKQIKDRHLKNMNMKVEGIKIDLSSLEGFEQISKSLIDKESPCDVCHSANALLTQADRLLKLSSTETSSMHLHDRIDIKFKPATVPDVDRYQVRLLGIIDCAGTSVSNWDNQQSTSQHMKTLTLDHLLLCFTSHIRENDAKIGSLETQIREKDTRMASLEMKVYDKDAQITILESHLKEKDTKIATLETHVQEKDTKLTSLETQIYAGYAKIVTLETLKKEKDTKMASLETQGIERDTRIATLEKHAKVKGTKMSSLETQIKEKDTRIASLETQVREKYAMIANLETNVKERGTKIACLGTVVKEKGTKITSLKKQVSEKGILIARMMKQIKESDAEITSLETQIEECDAEITTLETQVKENGTTIAIQETQVNETHTKITSLETQLAQVEDKYDKLWEEHQSFIVQLFVSESSATVSHVILGTGYAWGIATIGSELFVVRGKASHVEVYDTNNLTVTPRLLNICDNLLISPILAACSHYNCLYLSCSNQFLNPPESVIYRVELFNSLVTQWAVKGDCAGLSVTKDFNLLVTLCKEQYIVEYTTDGTLRRKISLYCSIDNPQHCIQLSDGNFIVCHRGSTQHRVCIVDSRGQILKSYGGAEGSGIGHLNCPEQLSVDGNGHVFVADYCNDRIQLLSPTLTLLGTVSTPGHYLNQPIAVHYDENYCRLYIEGGYARLLIVEVSVTYKK